MGNKFRPSLYSKKMELLNPIKRPLSLPLSLTARTSNFAVLILSRLFSLFDEKLEFYFRKQFFSYCQMALGQNGTKMFLIKRKYEIHSFYSSFGHLKARGSHQNYDCAFMMVSLENRKMALTVIYFFVYFKRTSTLNTVLICRAKVAGSCDIHGRYQLNLNRNYISHKNKPPQI